MNVISMAYQNYAVFLITLFSLVQQQLVAQASSDYVRGEVIDAETTEPLPGANIYIKDTYSGTNTNPDGHFSLAIDEFPVVVVIRHVGYETKELELERPTSGITIELNPGTVVMDELVVTDEDPAIQIMRRVIERKKEWRAELESWKADAYTRQKLRNEEGIVTIIESYSTSWWHEEYGPREIITDKRQTNNMMPDENFAGTSYLPNFYDDEIEISGFDMIGVTHPDALEHYNFEIKEQKQVDDEVIYEISVSPKSRLQPLFEGDITVSGSEYALLEVELTPGDAVFFPPPIENAEMRYGQSFSNYGGDFWLPTNMRTEGTFELGIPGFRFPEIHFSQLASIIDYQVNIQVPDSLYDSESLITTDNQSVDRNIRFEQEAPAIPLSEEENLAYETIDSTQTLEQAFEPSGFLTRFFDSSEEGGMFTMEAGGDDITGSEGLEHLDFSLTPALRYNRVEALHFGLRPEVRLPGGWSADGLLGYNTGQDSWAYGGRLNYRSGRFQADAGYTYDTSERVTSDHYGRVFTSIAPLTGRDDYFDHYHREHLDAGFELSIPNLSTDTGFRFNHERHGSLDKATNYSLPGGFIQRENLPVNEGTLNSIEWNTALGGDPAPLGIAGNNSFHLSVEHSNSGVLQSDFDFTRVQASADIRINTFLQRRLFANTLDLRLKGFTSTGTLPFQRFMGMDGSMTGFTPFGTFKSSRNRQLEGEHGGALFWEHNFRTVPFELIGLQGSRLVENGVGVILHGAHGRTWIDDARTPDLPDDLMYEGQWRHEVGLSINNLFRALRFDATYRIDEPSVYFGVSLTRFF